MLEIVKQVCGFSRRQIEEALPKGFFVAYSSGPSLGCHYYDARAFVDGILIAESHGHILPEREFRVTGLKVYADYRGKGYGRKICERLIEEAKAAGCQFLLFEGVDLDNAVAVQLYRNLGCVSIKSKTYPSRKDFEQSL
ncbi:GNAT family N-acetyltransferase [Pseudomonas cavernicola]|uniref:GNAT family N-acetyltransferase n=1 Tax=Pseudomonas cavernicola TaxID=2320866 RepID=A0A418XIM5_9PSED|nr:GNAT family N-acetyltransferase [Pseudomonas cavernicola]RJG12300.1 GNAT family N-acetyltransferase [Pseudomonas cavernicola]